MSLSPTMQKILGWLVSILVVLALFLGAVRLVVNSWYVEFEYRTPGFPADPFGFTLAERLEYSKTAIEYLVNDAEISFLGDLRFPEGQQTPDLSCQQMDDCTRLYNDRELEHMLDVKIVMQATLRVWYAALLFLAVLGIWAWRGGWMDAFRRGLSRGGFLTAILVAVLLFFVLAAFGVLFVFFHQLFFAAGTWTFFYSDTLIRLFPERFWRDTFMIVASLAAVAGLALGYFLRTRR